MQTMIFISKKFPMRLCLLVLFIASSSALYANIKLPALVGDRMVLQRNTPLKIWGWANKNERVTVTFLNQTKQTVTDKDGRWFIELPAQPEGGPYTMTLKGNNTITLKDILVGDVWVCGGQSNMGWKLAWSVNNHTEEIANANYPLIRLFQVKELLSYQVKEDVITDQGWQLCSPSSVPQFLLWPIFLAGSFIKNIKYPLV
jgi:sialate O-acetylesterase